MTERTPEDTMTTQEQPPMTTEERAERIERVSNALLAFDDYSVRVANCAGLFFQRWDKQITEAAVLEPTMIDELKTLKAAILDRNCAAALLMREVGELPARPEGR
jgi:hypothetical protein